MKCKDHPYYSGRRPPKYNCGKCNIIWEFSPNRKINLSLCKCIKCKKRINNTSKQLYSYCYEYKESCNYKNCTECLFKGKYRKECIGDKND